MYLVAQIKSIRRQFFRNILQITMNHELVLMTLTDGEMKKRDLHKIPSEVDGHTLFQRPSLKRHRALSRNRKQLAFQRIFGAHLYVFKSL